LAVNNLGTNGLT